MTAFHRSAEWQAFAKRMRPKLQADIDAGVAVCIDCGGAIMPGETWQVGHRLAHATHPHLGLTAWNVGPSHGGTGRKRCNQRAGGRLGRQRQQQHRQRRGGMIEWRRA